MTNPDEILKAQRQLSILSGTKKITLWLMVGLGVLCVVGAAMAVKEKTSISARLSGPLLTMVVFALTRSTCIKRIHELEASLHHEEA